MMPSFTQRRDRHHYVTLLNLQTTSDLSILLHCVISLLDATSCDKSHYFRPFKSLRMFIVSRNPSERLNNAQTFVMFFSRMQFLTRMFIDTIFALDLIAVLTHKLFRSHRHRVLFIQCIITEKRSYLIIVSNIPFITQDRSKRSNNAQIFVSLISCM